MVLEKNKQNLISVLINMIKISSCAVAHLAWPLTKAAWISFGGLGLHTWLQRIKVPVCPEATSFSHIFCSKQGFTHNTHTHKLVSLHLGKSQQAVFLSACHRFGLCLTLELYILFYIIIY